MSVYEKTSVIFVCIYSDFSYRLMKQRLLFLVDEGIRLLRSILGHFVLADPIRDPELQKSDSELSVSRETR